MRTAKTQNRSRKRKTKKNIEHGVAHIRSTFNN
ncbi:30S ribosomal protein S11, partial [Salmonella enterica subsp. enterica serovar Enteritidis]